MCATALLARSEDFWTLRPGLIVLPKVRSKRWCWIYSTARVSFAYKKNPHCVVHWGFGHLQHEGNSSPTRSLFPFILLSLGGCGGEVGSTFMHVIHV